MEVKENKLNTSIIFYEKMKKQVMKLKSEKGNISMMRK